MPSKVALLLSFPFLHLSFAISQINSSCFSGLKLKKAQSYLSNVLLYKEAIPIKKYTGGIGRHAAGKQHKAPGDKVAWPQKATKSFLDLLRNIESNAEVREE